MGISAIVLTHNSSDTIRTLIERLRFADEVIVIDDNSTDDTVRLAKKSGASVINRAVAEDFSAQRNAGLARAKGPWVLFVDADEMVTKDLADEIRKAVERIDVNGFFLKRQDTMWGKVLRYGETDNVRLMRLGRKGKGLWARPVHEVWNITGVVGTLEHPLIHNPHPNVTEFLADINRYSTINANFLASQRVPVFWWHIVIYPVGKFVQNYVVRQGFRDGMPGMIMAMMMSFHSFLTRAKLWQRRHPRPS